MAKAKIYTRTGDKGQTSLFTGQRVPKNDQFIEALGTVDECNTALGAALAFLPNSPEFDKIREQLMKIQHTLFDLGAATATPRTKAASAKLERTRFNQEGVSQLENWMDEMDAQLPPLTAFILPGGHTSGSMLHLARAICRRAERHILPLYTQGDVTDDVLMYLNRLSDYLFMASRFVNHLLNLPETTWTPHKT